MTAIEGLDEEISRKDEVIKDKVGLESQKTKVENQIKDENQRLTKEVEAITIIYLLTIRKKLLLMMRTWIKYIKIYQKEDEKK